MDSYSKEMINDRIAALIDDLGVTPNRFSDSISVNPTVIHNIIKGRRSKPSYDVLEKIISSYKELNTEWLLKGNGRVWKKKTGAWRLSTADKVEMRVLQLIQDIKLDQPRLLEIYELHELVEGLMLENKNQQKKMIKLHERQEEIIKTLMKLKKNF